MSQTIEIKTFSQALPILADHGITPEPAGGRLWKVGSLEYDKGGIVRLAREYAAVMQAKQQDRAARTGVKAAHSWGPTDIDSDLVGQLESAGYHWELAKQTPDGRWHHVISARNTALLRNDQVLLRRERLEALLAPATSLATTSTVLVGVAMMDQVEARQAVEQIKTHLDSARRQLLDLYEREGWRALGYSSWRACAQAEFGQSSAQIYRLLSAAQIEQAIDSPIGEIPEAHLRPLGKLDTPAEQRTALDRADQLAGDGQRTAKHVAQAVQEIRPTPATCIRCGSARSERRMLTSYEAGLVPEYPGRAVTLCSRCIPELLAAQRANEAAAPAPPAVPFWQSMSERHPTAHLWTRRGMNEHHAACGMVTQRAPSGSTEAGHCSSCVRATWPQNQAPTTPIPPALEARAKAVGLNVWINSLSEGGYQTGQDKGATNYTTYATLADLEAAIVSREATRANPKIPELAPITIPRRPASADVSAQLAYLNQLERYILADDTQRLTAALRVIIGDVELFTRQAQIMVSEIDAEGCATLASAIRALARLMMPDATLASAAVSAAGVRAALIRASELAGDDLTALADELDDATYEALAAYRRARQPIESAVAQ